MKRIFTFLLLALYSSLSFAQATQSLGYQAVIRDSADLLVTNESVGVQVSILQGSASGSAVYVETHTPTTNQNGLATLNIGDGTVVSGDFSTIDWSASSYFIQTETDPEGGTNYTITNVNQITSAPFALFSNVAETANTADYNTLTNLPTTITQAQSDKIDLITVTNATDLDQLGADVATNNAKVSFPGFGTVPGTALEGDNVIWQQSNDDVFYNQGKVAIGLDESATLDESALTINGALRMTGVPTQKLSGMLFYDSTIDFGRFTYVDNEGTDIVIPDGSVTYNSGVWTMENGDITTQNDVGIQGSLGVGVDISTTETYGFNTMILKENNLRILFDDADDPSGTAPANDWQFEFNESANGGTNHFAIIDQTNDTTPLKILAGAPTNAFYINESGNVGIGTNQPNSQLEVVGAVKATSFIGDGSGLTGLTGGTGGISNVDTTTIQADNDANNVGEIALQTANQTRLTITNEGNVGIGTAVPSSKLDVAGNISATDVMASGTISTSSISFDIVEETDTAADISIDVTGKSSIVVSNVNAQNIQGLSNGVEGQRITILNIGSGSKTIVHSGSGNQTFLLPQNTNIVLGPTSSASFLYSGTAWFCVGLSN